MRLRAEARVLPAVALAWLLAACSLFGVHVPDKPPPGAALQCDSAVALATLDAFPAIAGLGLGIFLLSAPVNPECCEALHGAGIPPLVGGLLYAASAIYGYASYARCRRLNADAAHGPHARARSASSP